MNDINSIAAQCFGLSLQEMRSMSPDAQFQLMESERLRHGACNLKATVKPRGNMLAILGKTTRSEKYTERARQISYSD